MPGPISKTELEQIIEILRERSCSMSLMEIAEAMYAPVSRRSLQTRLKRLLDRGGVQRVGGGRSTRYRLPENATGPLAGSATAAQAGDGDPGAPQPPLSIPLSPGGREIQSQLRTPPEGRTPAGFDRAFLDTYRPGETYLLSDRSQTPTLMDGI